EIIFGDFSRETVNAFKSDMESLYPSLAHARRLRALFDFRLITAPTPYSNAQFAELLKKRLDAADVRVAFLVKPNLFSTLLQTYLQRYNGHYELRIFTDRRLACQWLGGTKSLSGPEPELSMRG